MTQFVRCIDNGQCANVLTLGKVYQLSDKQPWIGRYRLVGVENFSFFKWRFIPVFKHEEVKMEDLL